MTTLRSTLVKRRLHLIQQSTMQREQLERHINDLRQPIQTIDNGFNIFKLFKLHPLLMFGLSLTMHQLRVRLFRKLVDKLMLLTHVSRLVKRLFIR
ncbi:MAG: hypothetical protein B7X95_04160 [Methylophilaceae bacterium 17-44-8]|jgi:hypothetical protein|nr:MAG: hypothetical protein B7Y48_08100 [Methylophilales bacterium 28-44-11]OZA06098.1 MAG: hypothetical protein B7X95_04160 [Methylophilaceae bacterium 17-44-8]